MTISARSSPLDARPEFAVVDPLRAPASVADRWWAGAALAVAIVTPVLAYVANLGLSSLVALAGFACLAAVRPLRTWPWGLWALAALVAWAVISYAWSPASAAFAQPKAFKRLDAITGLKLMLELGLYGAFIAGMSRVSAVGAPRALTVLTIGLALLLAILLEEAFSNVAIYRAARDAVGLHAREDFPIHHIARGCYIAVVLFWPAAFGLLRRRWQWAAVALWALTLASCVLLHVDSPTLALVVSTIVVLAVRFLGPFAIWTCAGLLVVYILLGPLLFALATHAIAPAGVSAVGKASWGARAEIWRFVTEQIAHRPLFGWGLDASRTWPDQIPLHPHDAALQIWLELGAVGALAADAFVVWLMMQLAKLAATDRPLAAIGTGCVCAYAVIGALSFGVWQEWWIATGAIGAAACFWFGRSRVAEPAVSAGPAGISAYFA